MFKALADPTRRSLLDELFRQDGQTLGTLEERFPMSRFGVMKHLKVLEEAGLVVTRRRGREKLHFLNPVPIRLVHDRWVSKYSEPWVAGLSEIKERLESQMEKVYEIFIKTTPERLWEAIVDPEIRAKYNFGAAVNSEWKVGAPISVDVATHGIHLGEGEVLADGRSNLLGPSHEHRVVLQRLPGQPLPQPGLELLPVLGRIALADGGLGFVQHRA